MKFALQVAIAFALVMCTEYVLVSAAVGTLNSLVHSQSQSAVSRHG